MLFKPTRRRTRPVSPRGRVSRDGAFEWGSVSLGALVHGLMSLQARWRRWALQPSPDGEARRDRVPEPAPAGWVEDGFGLEQAPDRAIEVPPAAEPLVYRRSRRTAAPAAAAPDAAPAAPERDQPERESVPAPAMPLEPAPAGGGVPAWQQPFSLPPNVRFTRTPDHVLRERARALRAGGDAAPAAPAAKAPSRRMSRPTRAPREADPPAAAAPEPGLMGEPHAPGPVAAGTRAADIVPPEPPAPAREPPAAEPAPPDAEPAESRAAGLHAAAPQEAPRRAEPELRPAFSWLPDIYLIDRLLQRLPPGGGGGSPPPAVGPAAPVRPEAANAAADGADDWAPHAPLTPGSARRARRDGRAHAPEAPARGEAAPPGHEEYGQGLVEGPDFGAESSEPAMFRREDPAAEAGGAGTGREDPAAAARDAGPPAPAAAPVALPAAGAAPSRPARPRRTAPPPPPDAGWPEGATFELPPVTLLAEPRGPQTEPVAPEVLARNAEDLERVLSDFRVKGEITNVRPGPVVTLYELEPAPGTKSSRVISLADDVARSMSAVSARVAVVQGRNAIGIELPNHKRETVFLRELLASQDFETTKHRLALCLGKTIGGEPVIADLARMPHLLVAGTTGSGKSVAINTMILSLVYRLKPEECRLIMVDPKMLELSVYDGIPHLLAPVVTDPKKAVIALKWAVREMEERYKKMSKLGVRNIDGFNARVAQAKSAGEGISRTVQTGFDRDSGEAVYEEEVMELEALPYIVVIVDEMADLMMVAGKDIEGAIQRLAQMARAAGIHVILATQRPSVDVITGTIKANFPTRISFQVTSKIDSRTILGEMGAEQLLGQGDMLYMAGGGRITRVHGPFCSDQEVEKVVAHLKRQGRPHYLEAVTAGEDEEGPAAEGAVFDAGEFGAGSGDLYEQAVAVVLRDKKASTSYIQRRLQIGYNRAASLMERMEQEGIVGPANHAGKRDILLETAQADE